MADQLVLGTGSGTARFSDDGIYRYDLTRRWGDGPLMLWIMLNPSTADATQNDPTIRRCIRFAERDGYGGIVVTNLFAYRATDPYQLLSAADPIGPENLAVISDWASNAAVGAVVCAWGAWWHTNRHRKATGLPRLNVEGEMRRRRPPLTMWCLGTTKAAGEPRHPLYVAKTQPFVEYAP